MVAAAGNERTDDGDRCSSSSRFPAPASSPTSSTSRASTSASSRRRTRSWAVRGPRPHRTRLPDRCGRRQRDADDLPRQRRSERGQRLHTAHLRAEVPVRADLFSDYVNEDSQILYDRNPKDRVQKVAPYLTLDSDPYPTVVDGRIKWVIDGYTTSANYPYSSSVSLSRAINDSNTRRRTTRSTTSTTSATR